jgi:small subunit ribosomal protein S6
MRGLVAREGGKVIKFTTWGKKKVQYEVKKQNRAIFIHMLYLGGSAIVKEIERNLRIMDDVMRIQTVKVADETDANRPVEQDVKLAGDAEQDRPFREERERRDDMGEGGERGDRGERGGDDNEPEETA